jgi:hypothetical protein
VTVVSAAREGEEDLAGNKDARVQKAAKDFRDVQVLKDLRGLQVRKVQQVHKGLQELRVLQVRKARRVLWVQWVRKVRWEIAAQEGMMVSAENKDVKVTRVIADSLDGQEKMAAISILLAATFL